MTAFLFITVDTAASAASAAAAIAAEGTAAGGAEGTAASAAEGTAASAAEGSTAIAAEGTAASASEGTAASSVEGTVWSSVEPVKRKGRPTKRSKGLERMKGVTDVESAPPATWRNCVIRHEEYKSGVVSG